MSSKAYKIVDSLFQEANLELYGNTLIEFSNIVYKEKNRTTILKHFYEKLMHWSIHKLHFYDLESGKKRNYLICENLRATMYYLTLFIPKLTSTVKTINEIKIFGENLASKFVKPIGKCIIESKLKKIMDFLDNEYSFSSKVFSKSEAVFLILPNTNREYNSECLCINEDNYNKNLFFLYHMKNKRTITPEAVLFHELGHSLHAQRYGNALKVPEDILDVMQKLSSFNLKQISTIEQCDIFADILGIGLMYQTPFEKYIPVKKFHPELKKNFKMMAENIINSL